MTGAIKLTLFVMLPVALCFYVAGARSQGGISPPAAAERQLIQLLRSDWNVARSKRCMDSRRFRPISSIPDRQLRGNRRWLQQRVRHLRRNVPARADCWRSHLWAESSAGRCVSSKEGGLTTVSRPSGTWHGKWQMNADFERTYGRRYVRLHGRASNWPEWMQDRVGYRGWQARGWHPWPNTARECGLL